MQRDLPSDRITPRTGPASSCPTILSLQVDRPERLGTGSALSPRSSFRGLFRVKPGLQRPGLFNISVGIQDPNDLVHRLALNTVPSAMGETREFVGD